MDAQQAVEAFDTPSKTIDYKTKHFRLQELNQINDQVITNLTEEGDDDFTETLE